MADAIDQWLDELAGRRQDDPMIAALRQTLLASQQDLEGQFNDLAFQRLLRRLGDEDLLDASPVTQPKSANRLNRAKRPETSSRWPRWLGIAAGLLLAIMLVRPPLPGDGSLQFAGAPAESGGDGMMADEADRELAPAQSKVAPPKAAMSISSPDSALTLGRQALNAFSASRESASGAGADDAEALAQAPPAAALQRRERLAGPPACQRGSGERLHIQLANLDLAQTRRFYAALAQIDALEFTYSRPAGPSDIMPRSPAARTALTALLAEFGWRACDLRGVTQLSLTVLPGGKGP